MKLNLTPSMQLTQEQRKRNVWISLIIGIVIVFLVQGISMIPADYIENTGAKEVYILFANIFVILALTLFCRFFQKRSLASLGFSSKKIANRILTGTTLAIIFLTIVFLLNLFAGSIRISSNLTTVSWIYVLTAFLGYFPQGLMEEIVCRGFIMNSISARYNIWTGLLVNSLIFAILHGLNPDITRLALLNLFLAGLLLSTIFYLTDNILFVGAFHAAWNFMLGPVLGVPVSGLSIYSSLFKTTLLPDHSLMNGGGFGFEGGLGLTISIIIAFITLFFLVRIRNRQEVG